MKRIGSTVGKTLAFTTLVVLLSSCIKLNMDLTVSTDNTVSGSAIVAIDKQLLALTGQPVDQIFGGDTIAPAGTQGVTTKDYEDDAFIGQEITFEGAPIDALSASEDPDALRIVREGDVFTVTGALDLTNDAGGDATNGAVEDAFASADIRISVTFPGPVTSSNGEIEGNTVSWSPKVGQRIELQAQASAIPSGSSMSPVLWAVIVAAVAVVVIGAVMMMRRRTMSTTQGPPAAAVLAVPVEPPPPPSVPAEPPSPPETGPQGQT